MLLAGLVIGFVLSAPASGAEVENPIGELNRAAYRAFQRKDFRRAEELAGRAWRLAEAEGDRLQAGLAAANTAAVLAIQRRMEDALAWYEKASDRLQETGRARQRGRLAAARGAVLYLKHDAERGDAELRRAAALLGEDDWRLRFLVTALKLWSDLDIGPAYENIRELAEGARRSGDPGCMTPALMALGWLDAVSGGGESAVELYREAIRLFEERGDAASVALAPRNIGVAYLRIRDLARAQAELGKALEEARRAGDVRLQFVALNDLGIALSSQKGRFELADRSTIFLDEVAELPLELQGKLLRVLQEGRFERLGNPRPIEVDARVIAATNRDLEQAVREGECREDLYYRLNVFPLTLPPLRERRGDVKLLVWAFVEELAKKMGKSVDTIPRKILAALEAYPWPGNVRELRNVVERAMILTSGPTLEVDLPLSSVSAAGSGGELTFEEAQRRHILAALERAGWRVRGEGGAAEALKLKPTTLETKMRKLGIRRPA